MMPEVVLQTTHLKKQFGSIRAVEDVSLSVKRGEIFGLLGPNGAGKTTTISMILGLTHPTAGSVEVLGKRVTPGKNRVLRQVGTLVGAPALLLPLSARRNLHLLSLVYPSLPRRRIDEVLERVGLAHVDHRAVRHFSTGMKQRMGLALALLNHPDPLILDEPTNGLDPAGMHEIRLLLRSLAEQGTSVFLSGHLLHEMELLCDRVAVVQRGRVIALGAVADLLNTKEVIRIHTSEPTRTAQALQALPAARNIQVSTNSVEVQGISSEHVLTSLVAQGIPPSEVTVVHPDLESVFLALTQTEPVEVTRA